MAGTTYFRSRSVMEAQIDAAGAEATRAAVGNVDRYLDELEKLVTNAAYVVRLAHRQGADEAGIERILTDLAREASGVGLEDFMTTRKDPARGGASEAWHLPSELLNGSAEASPCSFVFLLCTVRRLTP